MPTHAHALTLPPLRTSAHAVTAAAQLRAAGWTVRDHAALVPHAAAARRADLRARALAMRTGGTLPGVWLPCALVAACAALVVVLA
jgi:hypothetical protein